ncbi:hypothetical protein Ppb6_02421 [Photorhabdus australis subsp. thailandensis]|uniref:Uncharacterized protein n=1 Tax=Photorhabdus australis subsp. thailandensis TaxID=2805096 RepID=A0A1C0U343_9GAMM|nr:hypothetical protein Ppb6_02421 [Photorhabdus australis subsp. thailandensis]
MKLSNIILTSVKVATLAFLLLILVIISININNGVSTLAAAIYLPLLVIALFYRWILLSRRKGKNNNNDFIRGLQKILFS